MQFVWDLYLTSLVSRLAVIDNANMSALERRVKIRWGSRLLEQQVYSGGSGSSRLKLE